MRPHHALLLATALALLSTPAQAAPDVPECPTAGSCELDVCVAVGAPPHSCSGRVCVAILSLPERCLA